MFSIQANTVGAKRTLWGHMKPKTKTKRNEPDSLANNFVRAANGSDKALPNRPGAAADPVVFRPIQLQLQVTCDSRKGTQIDRDTDRDRDTYRDRDRDRQT